MDVIIWYQNPTSIKKIKRILHIWFYIGDEKIV